MKKLLPFLLLLLLAKSNFASHIAGAELTYECQGSGNYKFTYIFYRDCFGSSPPAIIGMNVSDGHGSVLAYSLLLDSLIPVEITACPGILSTCFGGTFLGIEKYIYVGYALLADTSSQWTFSVSIFPRPYYLTVFGSASSSDLYVEAKLNNTKDTCFNSPVFNNDPTIFSCVNQRHCIDLSASGNNSDSLTYSLIPPKISSNSTLSYNSGYSVSNPLVLNEPFEIDNQGQICFTPLQEDYSCYTVLVSSYKNGEIISQIERDIILYAINCGNYQPQISGINGKTTSDTSICAYFPFCLEIFSADSNTNDSTSLNWNNEIPGASFTVTDAKNDSAAFCWFPTAGDIDSFPHCFTVYVEDNSCHYHQTNLKRFCIRVYDLVSGSCTLPNSIANISFQNDLKIYPQPSASIINIDFSNPFSGEMNIEISDILNNKLLQFITKEQHNQYDLSDKLHSGIYLIYATDKTRRIIQRGKLVVGLKK
jgi:hypothetical protein